MSWIDELDEPSGPDDAGSGNAAGKNPVRRNTPRPPAPITPGGPPPGSWTVLSSTLLPGTGTSAIPTLIRLLCILAVVVGIVQSGLLGRVLTGLAWSAVDMALPLIIFLAVLAFFLPRVAGVVGHLIGSMLGAAASMSGAVVGAAVRNGRPAASQPGVQPTSLHCRRPNGSVTEVRVAQACNIPPGSHIRVFGPTLLGRRSAWWLRVHETNQLIVAGGWLSSLVMLVATAGVLWLIYSGRF